MSVASEQDARFFEALADRGDVLRDRAGGKLQPFVGLRFGQADDAAQVAVLRIERAAREDIGAAEARGVLRPLQHQHFHAFTQKDQRRRGAWSHHCHYVVRAARSLSLVALIMARILSQSASVSLSSST